MTRWYLEDPEEHLPHLRLRILHSLLFASQELGLERFLERLHEEHLDLFVTVFLDLDIRLSRFAVVEVWLSAGSGRAVADDLRMVGFYGDFHVLHALFVEAVLLDVHLVDVPAAFLAGPPAENQIAD